MAFTNGNDLNLLQPSDTATVGAGLGDDVYIIAPDVLGAGQRVTISDTQGANVLRFTGGLTVQSSRATGQSLELTLSNGAVVSILDADPFSYQLGGNGLSTSPVVQTYPQFLIESLGYSTVPGLTPVTNTTATTVRNDGSTGNGTEPPPPPPPPPPPTPVDTTALTTKNDSLTGDASANAFTGVLAVDPSKSTLNTGDVIDGAQGIDFLRIDASSDFAGFAAGKGTTGIEVLQLTNAIDGPRAFNTTGMAGLQRIEIQANDNSAAITGLAASSLPLTVKVSDVDEAQTFSVAFTKDVAIGINDALTFELNGVGRLATPTLGEEVVNLVANGIELLTLNALSGTSVVDASIGNARQLNLTGAGNLRVVDLDASVQVVNATQAQGDLSLDLLSAAGLGKVELGAGNDVVRVASDQLVPDARLTGGGGRDELILLRPSQTQDPTFGGFESVRLVDTNLSFNFSPNNISGFDSLTIERGIAPGAIVSVNGGLAPLNSVTLSGRSAPLPVKEGSVRYLNDGDLQLTATKDTVGNSEVRARFDAPLLDNLSATVANGVTYTDDEGGALVSIASASRFALSAAANSTFAGVVNAPRVNDLVVSGLGDVMFAEDTVLGQKDQTVTINAANFAGDLFSLNVANVQDLVFQGGLLGTYNLTLTGDRSTLSVNTGINMDKVTLNDLGAGPHAYDINLGDISVDDELTLNVLDTVTQADFRPLQLNGVDEYTFSAGKGVEILLPEGLIPDDTFTFIGEVRPVIRSSAEDEIFDFEASVQNDAGGNPLAAKNIGSFVFAADEESNGFDEILNFAIGDAMQTLDFTAFNDELVFATKGALGREGGEFTKNPMVLGGVDVGDQIVRLVDIAGGQDITTAEGLTTALRADGEYANLNIKDGSSVFLTGPDANGDGTAESPTSVFYVTLNGDGLETATAVGVIRAVGMAGDMVGVTEFTIDDFAGASAPPGLFG